MSSVYCAPLDDPNPPSPGPEHRREVARRARQLRVRHRAAGALAMASALAVVGAGAAVLFGSLPPHQHEASTSRPRVSTSAPKSVAVPRQSPSAPDATRAPSRRSAPAPSVAPNGPFGTLTYGDSNDGQLVAAFRGGWLVIVLSVPPGAHWGQAATADNSSAVLRYTSEMSDANGEKRIYFTPESTGVATVVVPCRGAGCTTAVWRLRVYVSPTWPPPRGWRLNSYPGCWTAQQKGGTARYC